MPGRPSCLLFAALLSSLVVPIVAPDRSAAQPPATDDPAASQGRERVESAEALLEALGDGLSSRASFPFDDEKERRDWSNLPASMHPRNGVAFGEMSGEQQKLAHRLMRSGLSSQGYLKASGVVRLEDILLAMFEHERPQAREMFGSDKYWLALFGTPDAREPWGWQFDGHHLGINFTAVGDALSVSPMFFGAEPDVVEDGPYAGWSVFAAERRKAFELAASLSAQQRQVAVLADTTPNDIVAGPGRADALKEPAGLPADRLDEEQRSLLWNLIDEYLDNAPAPVAAAWRKRVEADGLAALHFAWMGPIDFEGNLYYRVHGPSLLIEYDNTGAGSNGPTRSNHVHLILRDPSDDYGEDLLDRHYREHPHDGTR